MSAALCWVGRRGPWGRNVAWTHPAYPGLEVRHCGHPTALRPYYIVGLLGELGCYRRLAHAQRAAVMAVDWVAAGGGRQLSEDECRRLRLRAQGLPLH